MMHQEELGIKRTDFVVISLPPRDALSPQRWTSTTGCKAKSER